ncbi:hypothetical protein LTR86_005596 [Recurvomyces mirabilis]|nr:hypothetical protein LTR86_005596 [Recurvomyces mirabilis]
MENDELQSLARSDMIPLSGQQVSNPEKLDEDEACSTSPNTSGATTHHPILFGSADLASLIVEFDGPGDPLHAQNWPLRKKLSLAVTLGYVTFVVTFTSSIFSAASESVAHHFGVSPEVGVLGVSLYVLGFATGPVLWAPLSELYGRRLPLLVAAFGSPVFNLAVATGKDLQTVFICRFLAGFFGACPLTCVGAVFADIFNNSQRGLAITALTMTVFVGPLWAPFIGGFINMSHLGWRWTQYLSSIMGFFGFGLACIFVRETYAPVILVHRAQRLRRETGNWAIHAKQEEIEITFRELVEKNLARPLRMLFTEPIVLALSIYMAFIYGLLYLFLTFYPIVFEQIHGFNQGVGGLPFLGMITGEMLAGVYVILTQPEYNRKLAANNDIPIPEWRMPPAVIGGMLFAGGILWFGWTGFRADIHWIVPTLSGLPTGFGIMVIFLACFNYLVDAYSVYAASAIAANTILRSLAGAGFPLFATYMIEEMGVQWAGLLLSLVGFLLVPLPVLFWLKGATIRERSNFTPTSPVVSNESSRPNAGTEEEC